MIILIPCYRPDAKLLALVAALGDHRIVIVDDGSGPAYVEVPITTVYIDGNRSSHIRLPEDLIRIYPPDAAVRRVAVRG